MADKRISQLVDRGTVANNDVVPIVVSGATTTNKATISSIQTFMQGNLDLGVTSVGITLGSSGTDVSVSGSPITSSGNITINIPTASATNRGLLSAADWVTFNSKQDAGSFVTLDTTQTITAQKTFTTSGSSDTMIISHGSGSGFALDVLKAGNGEAIRVTKTSGSGNAMTISGGNFEAGTIVKTGGTSVQYLMADGSVSTLTNPVTGTGAAGQVAFWNGTNSQAGSNNLYWDNANVKLGIGISTPEATGLTVAGGGILVSLDSGAARKVLELYATSTGAKVSSTYVGASSYGSLELLTSNVPRLTITAAGAATFSKSVTLGTHDDSNLYSFERYAVGAPNAQMQAGSADNNVAVGFDFLTRIADGSQILALNIAGTGEATFSSSVTVAGESIIGWGLDNSGVNSRVWGIRNGLSTGGDLAFITSSTNNTTLNTTRLTINRDGNVGIGTASPRTAATGGHATLDIKGGIYFGSTASESTCINNDDSMIFNIDANNDASGVNFFRFATNTTGETGGTELMRITDDGNVGIGTASPATAGGAFTGLDIRGSGGGSIVLGTTSTLISYLYADSTAYTLQTTGSIPIVFFPGGTEAMRITSVGKTQIKADTSDYSLTVVNAASNAYGMYIEYTGYSPNSTNFEFIYCADSTQSKFIVWSNGNVVNRNNSYGAISDLKLKENIEDATPKLDDLMKVKVRNYNLIGDDKKQIGVIAQELEEVFPAMIDESEDFEEVEVPQLDEEGNEILNEEGEVVTEKQRVSKGTSTKSVKYSVFVPMLIKAIQELKTEIDSLKNQMQ